MVKCSFESVGKFFHFDFVDIFISVQCWTKQNFEYVKIKFLKFQPALLDKNNSTIVYLLKVCFYLVASWVKTVYSIPKIFV